MEHDLFSSVRQFLHLKVLVIGDAILDTYVRGKADRLSLEAPAPVVAVRDDQEMPGGAANAAVHAKRLGASVEFLGVVGNDAEGNRLLDLLREEGIRIDRVICDPQRKTLLKRSIYADDRLLVRYDQGSSNPIETETENRILKLFSSLCSKVDVVILSDYGQGLLTERLLGEFARIQTRRPCLMVADTRRLQSYRNLQLAAVRPSYHSALEILDAGAGTTGDGTSGEALEKLSEAAEKILERLDTQVVAITLDDNGALVIERDSQVYRTYAPAQPFNRVRGAGDAFIAALSLGLAAGAPAQVSAEIASALATITVERQGVPICSFDELKTYLSGDGKLYEDWESLGARLDTLRQQGRRIVFTNGVFDILHSAHVAYLNQAKSFGDILVIGVNSDESVKRLKGPTRPINNLLERSRVLAGLSCVDFVVPFCENNPINLIHVVRPSIYVKGGDYTRETLPETEVVEQYGGELKIVPYIVDHSTSGVIERIRSLNVSK